MKYEKCCWYFGVLYTRVSARAVYFPSNTLYWNLIIKLVKLENKITYVQVTFSAVKILDKYINKRLLKSVKKKLQQ